MAPGKSNSRAKSRAKTKMCVFNLWYTCKKGDQCSFAHSQEELLESLARVGGAAGDKGSGLTPGQEELLENPAKMGGGPGASSSSGEARGGQGGGRAKCDDAFPGKTETDGGAAPGANGPGHAGARPAYVSAAPNKKSGRGRSDRGGREEGLTASREASVLAAAEPASSPRDNFIRALLAAGPPVASLGSAAAMASSAPTAPGAGAPDSPAYLMPPDLGLVWEVCGGSYPATPDCSPAYLPPPDFVGLPACKLVRGATRTLLEEQARAASRWDVPLEPPRAAAAAPQSSRPPRSSTAPPERSRTLPEDQDRPAATAPPPPRATSRSSRAPSHRGAPGQQNSQAAGLPAANAASDEARRVVNAKLFKTKLCMYHAVGKCNKGAGCTFAHSPKELLPAPDFSRTSLCPALQEFGKCERVGCTFAHKRSELQRLAGQGGFSRVKL